MTKVEKVKRFFKFVGSLSVSVLLTLAVRACTRSNSLIVKVIAGIGGVCLGMAIKKPVDEAIEEEVDQVIKDIKAIEA